MDVHQGAYVLVTDGCKALLLQNEGDAEFPDLRLVLQQPLIRWAEKAENRNNRRG